MNTVNKLPGPRPMRAEYREALRRELQTVVVAPAQSRGRLAGQFGSWSHRAVVSAVVAAIVVVFFVPLPHVSLFHSLVAPARSLPASTQTVPSAKVTPTAVSGADVEEASQPVGLAVFGSKVWVIGLGKGAVSLFVSVNGGKSFASLPSSGMYGLACDATATSAMTLWGFCATGSLGYAVRSVDGGRRFAPLSGWNRGHKGSAANSGVILPLSNKEAVLAPDPSSLYLTRDGGADFANLLREPPSRCDLQVAFASPTTWVVLGLTNSGLNPMWRSTNGSRTWQLVKAPRVKTTAAKRTVRPTGVLTGYADACTGTQVTVGEVLSMKVSLYFGSRSIASENLRTAAKYRFAASFRFTVPPGVYTVKFSQRVRTGTVRPYPPRVVVARAGRITTAEFPAACL